MRRSSIGSEIVIAIRSLSNVYTPHLRQWLEGVRSYSLNYILLLYNVYERSLR